MNITRRNFFYRLPFVLDTLNSCNYIAFDFEFSGIKGSDKLVNSGLDPVKKKKHQ